MTKLKNNDVRDMAKKANVRMWEVARAMGCSDNTLTRLLRDELPTEQKKEIISLISRIAQEGGLSFPPDHNFPEVM